MQWLVFIIARNHTYMYNVYPNRHQMVLTHKVLRAKIIYPNGHPEVLTHADITLCQDHNIPK